MTFDESRVYAIDGPPEKWRQAWRRRGENATYIIQGAAFSSDSTRLALAAGFSDIRILATATGQELARLTPPDPWIWALAWSPDDRWLAVTSDSSVFLWDMHLLHTRLRELGLDWE
jgi:WD40 repeat protein